MPGEGGITKIPNPIKCYTLVTLLQMVPRRGTTATKANYDVCLFGK